MVHLRPKDSSAKRAEAGQETECPHCDGTGYIREPDGIAYGGAECIECDGTGRERDVRFLECQSCDGQGEVQGPLVYVDWNDGPIYDDGPCDACDGTGSAETPVQPITMEDLP